MNCYITTLCIGNKYLPIKQHWVNRVKEKCNKSEIVIFDNTSGFGDKGFNVNMFEFIWAYRWKHNLDLLTKYNKPVVMCDLDIIIEKDIDKLVDSPYDIVISREIGGDKCYPQDCSSKLGFGICCGFMIVKPSAIHFMNNIFSNMKMRKYNTYDDQVSIMKHIVNSKYSVNIEECSINGVLYKNNIINIDNIKICVLDFNIIIRDPLFTGPQIANHINIDNVGGVNNFIKYFYNKLENLPLTCRCGKKHLGDNNKCPHIEQRIRNK